MAIFKMLHGDDANISLDVTPFHEGWVYITSSGYYYVDLNIGTAESPNNQRIKLNAANAETLTGKTLEEITNSIIDSANAYTDSRGVFVATPHVTTFQEVVDATNAGRIVQVRDAGGVIYPLCVCSEEDGQCLFLLSEPGVALAIMLASDNTWSSMEVPYASAEELSAHITNEDVHFTAAERDKLGNIEVGAQRNTITSVNGKTGAVNLSASDVGALPDTTEIPSIDIDDALSDSSENPVQNKVITNIINQMAIEFGAELENKANVTDYNESIIGLSVDGRIVTYIKGDGSVHTFETQDTNTTYSLGTDATTGLTKLYATTGSAEDGTMTQKAIKTELDKKVGVSIDDAQGTLIFTI